jgi:hypothetical protein
MMTSRSSRHCRRITMNKAIIIAVCIALVGGCSSEGRFVKKRLDKSECDAKSGFTRTTITYGDGKIHVKPESLIHTGTEWRFYLEPEVALGGPSAFGDSKVTVRGKNPGDKVLDPRTNKLVNYKRPGPPPSDNSWLKAEGTYNRAKVDENDDRYIETCVPSDAVKDQEWYYSVKIVHVGSVDPRGKIEK